MGRQADAPTPPARPVRRIIERPRLLKLLEETDAQTILLVAPPGYGKTTLARQWAAAQDGPIAWYSASPADGDAVVLARGLADAVTAISGGSLGRFEEFLNAHDAATSANRIAATLADAIQCAGVTALVVDDYHLFTGRTESEQVVEAIRRRTTLRLVVTSRSRPTWAKPRLVVYGDVVEIGRTELALTADEAAKLLADVKTDAAARLAHLSEGWPAMLGLAVHAADRLPPDGSLPLQLYDYFADELIGALSITAQEALAELALLDSAPSASRDAASKSSALLEDCVALGLLSAIDGRYELHPLLREFLLTRLEREPDADDRISTAINHMLGEHHWEAALELTVRFRQPDEFVRALTAAYRPLMKRGQVATLAGYAARATSWLDPTEPVLELLHADIARRRGDHGRAIEMATRVAELLARSHPLRSQAYALAGHAAFSLWQMERAADLFSHALEAATEPTDASEATWGLALTAIYGNAGAPADAITALEELPDHTSVDRVRLAMAKLSTARISGTGLSESPELEGALHIARQLPDPAVRTSFLVSYAYALGLKSRYEEALRFAQEALNDAETSQLDFVVPHAQWQVAFASLGLRRFGDCERSIQRIERLERLRDDPFHALNTRALRARLFLSTNQLARAQDEIAYEAASQAQRAMWEEYQATRVLVAAVSGDAVEMPFEVSKSSVEVRTLLAMARAVGYARRGERTSVLHEIKLCTALGTWDAFVCAIRAFPAILEIGANDSSLRPEIERVLTGSRDFGAARSVGIRLRRRTQSGAGVLSPREREVHELLRNGLTNREIARALFISEQTAKVHVRHVLEKLGARTRAEAAGRIVT